ncbi:unnamed protein product [Ectocarpus fasciculatus]
MTTTGGGSKCLDAFMIALNQACDGEGNRWYVSTLELQLVSLEFCGACRSAQLLDVRVDEPTPPTLWTSRTSHTTPGKRSKNIFISKRVPAVQAFGWKWDLSIERLPNRAAFDRQPRPECPQHYGHFCEPGVGSVVWPRSLKRLAISWDMPIHAVSWPASLQQLLFGGLFNQSIVGVTWPASLQQLSFRAEFNQPIVGVTWPTSITSVTRGRRNLL